MSFFQKLFKAILPKDSVAAMEAESRAWMMQCPSCGHEISVWEAGGIRFGASGKPSRLMRCSQCGQRTWHRTYKKTEDQPQGTSTN
jgi:transposase-like protein